MANFDEKIEQANNEARQRIQSLPDAALIEIQRNPDQHSQQEISFATQALEKRYPTARVTVRPAPPKTYWMDSCIFWATFLILGTVLGGLLGLGAGILWLSLQGWTEPWQPISPPPKTPTNIVAINEGMLWVETNDGTLYYNENTDCENNCWQQVENVPVELVPPGDTFQHKPQACVWVAPFLGAKVIRDECNRGGWTDRSIAYALRLDGKLFVWRFYSGGEWVVVGLFIDMVIGIILGPIVVIVLGRRRNPSTTNR